MFQEASLAGVFRILFWFFLIAIIVRVVVRLAMPVVVRKSHDHLRRQAEEMLRRQQEARRPARQEGQVTVEKESARSTKGDGGEYVDYIEIKE